MTTIESTQEAREKADDYKIIVNGQEKEVVRRIVTFDEIVTLAGYRPDQPNVTYTVTYRKAVKPKHEGTMTEGDTVEVKDGTVFNVTATTKS